MSSPRVEVICIGTELLTGKVNTHVAYMGPKLGTLGLQITQEHTVGDDPELMREIFSESYRRSHVVICAGGLGPTFDDITRDVWSGVVKRPLIENATIVKELEKKFRTRGFAMPPANRRQAQVLKGAEVLNNPFGTAPGQYLQVGNKAVILLPGPTREMVPMFETMVAPRLRKKFPQLHLRTKTFLMTGVPESKIDHIIRPFVEKWSTHNGCRITHGILASQSIVSVKFTVEAKSQKILAYTIKQLSQEARRLLGEYVFGEDEATLESAIGNELRRKKQTLAVAESCTGGLISKMLTDLSGASDYFREGVVTYHNQSKMNRLGVKAKTLSKYGAVSAETAREMAEGLRRFSKSTYALSVTGIAGPTGATKSKPVGLVYIGCVGPKRTTIKEFRFNGERAWIRHRAAIVALDILRRQMLSL